MAAPKLALALVALCLTAAALQAPVASAATWHVSGDAGTDQGGCGVEPGTAACKTLDYAIDLAAAGDTVTAAHGKYGITQVLEKSITITGEGRFNTFLTCPTGRALMVTRSAVVTVVGMHIQDVSCDAFESNYGGCILANETSTVELDGVVFGHCAATSGGAVAALDSATLILRSSSVENNTATSLGGGVYLGDTTKGYFYNTHLDDNEVDQLDKGSGGAVAIVGSAHAEFYDCEFSKNSAAEFGGDFEVRGSSTLEVYRTTFFSSFVQVGRGLILHATGFNNITFVDSVFVDSACGFGDCVASFLLSFRTLPATVPLFTLDGCTFNQPTRAQMQPLRSVIIESLSSAPAVDVAVRNSRFLTGRETFFFFSGVTAQAYFSGVMFKGARAVAYQGAGGNVTMTGITAMDTEVEFGGGFIQMTCMTAGVLCTATVSHSTFTDVGCTPSNTYGGVFALSGKSVTLYASNLTATYSAIAGMAAVRGGIFAVLNGATVHLADSNLQSQASFGGVFYLAPAQVPWALTASDATTEQDFATVYVTGTTFHSSRGIDGGAVVDANTGKTIEQPTSRFHATDCKFIGCSANGEGGVVTTWYGLDMTATRCTFLNNYAGGSDGGGGVISVAAGSNLTFTDCHFKNNRATHTGGMLLAKNDASVRFFGGSVVDGFAKSGGVFYLKQSSTVVVSDAVFQNNQADIGGVATLIQTGNLVFSNCRFAHNTASKFGGVMNAVGSSAAEVTDLSVFNSVFDENRCDNGRGGAISLGLSASSELRNCTISNSYAKQTGGALYLDSASLVILRKVVMEGGNAESGASIFATGGAKVYSYDSQFLSNRASIGGAVAAAGVAYLQLERPRFSFNTGIDLGGSLYAAGRSVVNMSHGYVSHTKNAIGTPIPGQGGVMYAASFATYYVRDSVFHNNLVEGDGGVLSSIGNAKSYFTHCTFNQSTAEFGGVFALDTSSQAWITDSLVTGSVARFGAGLVTQGFTSQTVFTRVTVFNTTAPRSGVIGLTESAKATFIDCNITNSTAYIGGVLVQTGTSHSEFVGCTVDKHSAQLYGGFALLSEFSTSSVTSSVIAECRAGDSGGVLYTPPGDAAKLTLADSTIRDNSATYGGVAFMDSCANIAVSNLVVTGNVAQEAAGVLYFNTLEDVYSCQCTGCTVSGNKGIGYGDTNATVLASVRPVRDEMLNVVSGALLSETKPPSPPLVIIGLDQFGQKVHRINTRLVVRLAAVDEQLVVGGRTVKSINPAEVKDVEQLRNLSFSEVKFSALPGSTQPLDISVIYPLYATGVTMNLTMALCEVGQVLQTGSTVCFTCKPGTYTFYSTEQECHSCPIATAHCAGGNQFKVKTGWWRRSTFSNETIECLFGPACLGYPMFPNASASQVEFIEQTMDFPEGCAEGYRGNLCFGCSYGYGRAGEAGCGACPSPVVNRLLIAAGIIVSIIVMAILIYRTRKSAADSKDKMMMMIKIFMSYLQFVGLAAGLQIDWPKQLLSYFSIQSGVTSASDRIVSLDCWLRQADSPVGEVFFEMQFVYTMLPIFGLSLIALYWGSSYAYKYFTMKRHTIDGVKKLRSVHIDSAVVSVIVFAFFLHPTITQQTFQMFTCRELFPNEFFLVADLDVRCYTPDHMLWMMGVGLFRLVFYVIAIPLGAFFVLYRQRQHLDSQSVRDKYGFLYVGFSVRAYYWEIVIMVRKVLVISIVVFFKQFGTLVQVMLALGLVYMSYVLHVYERPYHKMGKNELEDRQNEIRRRQEEIDQRHAAGRLAALSSRGNTIKLLASGADEATVAASVGAGVGAGVRSPSSSRLRSPSSSALASGRQPSVREGSEQLLSVDESFDGESDDEFDEAEALRELEEEDSLGMEDLDHLEHVSLLATLGTFYFGYFLNAETINAAGKTALVIIIFLVNAAFLLIFLRTIKVELVRKAKEIGQKAELAKAKLAELHSKRANKNRRRLPANEKGAHGGAVEMRPVGLAQGKLPPAPTFAPKVSKKKKKQKKNAR